MESSKIEKRLRELFKKFELSSKELDESKRLLKNWKRINNWKEKTLCPIQEWEDIKKIYSIQ